MLVYFSVFCSPADRTAQSVNLWPVVQKTWVQIPVEVEVIFLYLRMIEVLMHLCSLKSSLTVMSETQL